MERERSILLASGGLDSTALAYWLVKQSLEIIPLFINYGQHSVVTEQETVLKVLPGSIRESLIVVDVSTAYQGSSSKMLREANLWIELITDNDLYVPYRNQLILTLGAAMAATRGCNCVYSAFINSNVASGIDCSTSFLQNMSLLSKTYGGVELRFPFKDLSKAEVATIGIDCGAPIAETYSCLVASKTPCGACANCVDRNFALVAARTIQKQSMEKSKL